MKAFQCTCGQPLFFHNEVCLGCGAAIGYDPTCRLLGALAQNDDGSWSLQVDHRDPFPTFRLCEHRTDAAGCNWLVPAERAESACLSCRLTRTIPTLDDERNALRLLVIETAKRRVLFGLQACGLSIVPRDEDPQGLAFDFLEAFPGQPVLTGHAGGVVTINIAEADADYREKHRESLHEPYRTVIGHLRHEIGHYYWNVLVASSEDWLNRFRELFGDERADYGLALDTYYRDGPPADWAERFISAYAASHPWEDWAESWAHYLHLRATLQTVASFALDISNTPLRITPFTPDVLYDPQATSADAFLGWINAWVVLTTVLNETARSMGQPDVYPFVMNRATVTKLHFVQCVIETHGAGAIVIQPPEHAAEPLPAVCGTGSAAV